jgi:hypothetical protein
MPPKLIAAPSKQLGRGWFLYSPHIAKSSKIPLIPKNLAEDLGK